MNEEGPVTVQAPSLIRLFLSFLRLGLTAYGGPAMVAHIRKMTVQDKHWLDEDTFRGGVALCQTIPGATAMQTAAYVGLELNGVKGAAASFIGFGLPAFLLMLGLSFLYARFQTLPALETAFGGLRALIVALVAQACVTFGRSYLKNWRDLVIAGLAAELFWFGLTPILVVGGAALLGVVLANRRKGETSASTMMRARFHPIPLIIVLGSAALGLILLLIFDKGLFHLALLMMKVDLFAFGGGFAALPLMLHEVVGLQHWMDQRIFMDGIAFGQITPGPIVITATFVGYLFHGLLGAMIATLSIFLPSFTMVIVTAPSFARLNASPPFRNAVKGILCSFVGLLLTMALRLGFDVQWSVIHVILSCAAFAALLLRVDVAWVIVSGAALSILLR
jgi:chromate transporter